MRTCLIAALALVTPACTLPLTLVEVAHESADGVAWIDPTVPVALADDGTVAFSGKRTNAEAGSNDEALFVARPPEIVPIPLAPSGHHDVRSVQVNSKGHVAFLGRRTSGTDTYQGVYTTALGAPIVAQMEQVLGPPSGAPPFLPHPNVALSESDLLAYSTIYDGTGGVSRGPIGGPFTSVLYGSSRFYNSKELDVNESGTVAIQLEYNDPTRGLSRGLLLVDAPTYALDGLRTAIEKMDVGSQPAPAVNARGAVAFALAATQTLNFYEPPDVASGSPVETLVLEPGVYVAEPTPFGRRDSLSQLADTHHGFAAFGRVVINDEDVVVFEATLDDGRQGLFSGPDPERNKILVQMDTWGRTTFKSIKLGEINRAGDISVLTTELPDDGRRVFVVRGLGQQGWLSVVMSWELMPPGS